MDDACNYTNSKRVLELEQQLYWEVLLNVCFYLFIPPFFFVVIFFSFTMIIFGLFSLMVWFDLV